MQKSNKKAYNSRNEHHTRYKVDKEKKNLVFVQPWEEGEDGQSIKANTPKVQQVQVLQALLSQILCQLEING